MAKLFRNLRERVLIHFSLNIQQIKIFCMLALRWVFSSKSNLRSLSASASANNLFKSMQNYPECKRIVVLEGDIVVQRRIVMRQLYFSYKPVQKVKHDYSLHMQ